MVKLGLLLSAVGALAACLPLDQSCFDGGMCVGGVCGADGYCHPTALPTGTATGTTSGTTGAGPTTSASGPGSTTGSTTGATSSGTSTGSAASTGNGSSSSSTTGGPVCTPSTTDGGVEQVISGTITLSPQAGWLYVQLLDFSRVNNGIPTAALQSSQYINGDTDVPFVLHGAQYLSPSDTYAVAAFVDTLGDGVPNLSADQVGMSALTSLSELLTPGNGLFVPLSLPALDLTNAGGLQFGGAVRGSDGEVLVLWQRLFLDAGMVAEAPTIYLVCLTDGGSAQNCANFPPGPGTTGIGILSAPSSGPLQVSIQALVGDGGTLATGTVTSAAGAGKMSGAVSGAANVSATIYVVAVGQDSFALTTAAPDGDFSFSGVQPGSTYQIFVFADLADAGALVPGDPTDLTFGGNLYECFTGSTSCDPGLGTSASTTTVSVNTSPGVDGGLAYALVLNVAANDDLPVNATAQTSASETIDLPLQNNGPPVVSLGTTLPSSSAPPPSCVAFTMTYGDGGSETATRAVTYIPSIPSAITVNESEVFWKVPTSSTGPLTYTVEVVDSSCNQKWKSDPVASFPCAVQDLNLDGGDSVIVIAADELGNTASSGCNQDQGQQQGGGGTTGPVVVQGTIAYPEGGGAAVVFLQLFGNNGNIVAGTAVLPDAGGAFAIHSLAGAQTLSAWADVAGSGHFVPALDPIGYAAVDSSGNLQGPLTLTPPQALEAPSYASIDELYAGDTGFVVIVQPSYDSTNQTEIASSYIVDIWTTDNASGIPVASLTIPAGGSTAAIFNDSAFGLTSGQIYYFTATALNQSGSVQSGIQSLSFPPQVGGSVESLNGPLVVPFGTGSAYVGSYAGYGTTSIPNDMYATYVFIEGAAPWYFVDVNNDGLVETTEPGLLPPVFVTTGPLWDAGTSLGPLIEIQSTPVLCSVAVSTQVVNAAPSYNLSFAVQSNLSLPLTASLDGGPNLSGPLDLGSLGPPAGEPQCTQLVGSAPLGSTSPGVGDAYDFLVGTPDGVSSCTAAVEAVFELPSALSISLASSSVGWNWSSPNGFADDTYAAFASDPNGQQVWFMAGADLTPTMSVPFSADAIYDGGFQVGTAYQLTVQIQDNQGNQSVVAASVQL